jgi:predicted DNA-binding protein with PD1-like motif
MQSRKTNTGYIIVLARGESLIPTLTDFCAKEGIASATFTGIGAVERVQIGYYDLGKREYFFRDEAGVFEVASMNGNVALVGGKPFIHAHAVLSRCDESLECIGAHIKEAYVAVTLEVFLTPLGTEISRALNEDIGLKLLNL